MHKKTINIGLLGLGTVGTGTLRIINNNVNGLTQKTGTTINVKRALVKNINKNRLYIPSGLQLTNNPSDLLDDSEIDIIVEVMGGISPAKELITQALSKGKHIVTANKDLMAQHGVELLALANKYECSIYYEASVGGGIPLIRPLKNCLAANRILNIMGIINGTTNYILTQMTVAEKDFADALAEAQDKGFAEQEPSSDLEGKDAAYKLAILASLAFNSKVDVNEIYTESINHVSVRDIMYAKDMGFVIKLLALGEENNNGLSLRVHPTLVPENHPLASVQNEFNALFLEGDAVGEVMFYGRGAGSLPTASAIVADIVEIIRRINNNIKISVADSTDSEKQLIPMLNRSSSFYVRMKAKDESGVFGSVATAFGDEGVSLDMIIQNQRDFGIAEIVLVTHKVLEKKFYRALNNIKQLNSIRNLSNVIRVLERRSADVERTN